MNIPHKPILLLLIVVATLLRLAGLSHDLHEGRIYHPDTPKQMRAVERFLDGRYYQHTGIADYDGYPYLTPHLVEMLCRIGMPVHNAALNLVGIPTTGNTPDIHTIYWIALLLNTTLSVLLVPLVYRIGREHLTPGAGLLAAACFAVSPADVTSCHYTNGDTAAACFATLSLFYALRIRTTGLLRHYVAAGAFAVAAFAAKYHAGVAVFPIALAHLYRYPSPRAFCSWPALRRVALTALVAGAALFLTIPTLILHTQPVIQDILGFFEHVSRSSRLPDEIQSVGALGRFQFAMSRNGPVLLQIFGAAVCLAAPLALLLRGRRQPPLVIIASVPLVYFLIGVSFRPLAPAVYHTIMTPMVFLLAAALLTASPTRPAIRRLWRPAAAALTVFTLFTLTRESLKEDFFQWHQDTRRIAHAWSTENIPAGFYMDKDRYTFTVDSSPDEWPTNGILFARSSIAPGEPPANFLSAARFRLETASLMQFRNPDVDLWLGASFLIRPDFRMPLPQRWPSQVGNQFIFEDTLTFLRDGKTLDLSEDHPAQVRRLVCPTPLTEAWLIVRNGPLPNIITLSFAGTTRTLHLASGATEMLHVTAPRDTFPRQPGVHLYRLSATTGTGPARVTLSTTPAEAGRALFDAGRFADAAPLLAAAAPASRNPMLATLAILARTLTGQPPPPPEDPLVALARQLPATEDDAAILAAFGISPRYLDRLPFASFTADELEVSGHRRRPRTTLIEPFVQDTDDFIFTPPPPPTRRETALATPSMLLSPGHYRVSLLISAATLLTNTPTLRTALTAPGGTILNSQTITLPTDGLQRYTNVTFAIVVPDDLPSVKLVLHPENIMAFMLQHLTIAPDVAANLRALRLQRDVALDNAFEAASSEPLALDILLAAGDAAARQGDPLTAAHAYQAARRARPETVGPLASLAAIRQKLPPEQHSQFDFAAAEEWSTIHARQQRVEVDAQLENGLRLNAAEFRETQLSPGGQFAFNLYWELEKPMRLFDRGVVWVHVIDANGRIAFQADHGIAQDLQSLPNPGAMAPVFREFPIPPEVPPGTYRVKVGVMHSSSDRRRIKIIDARQGEVKGAGIILPLTLEIVAQP